MTIYNSLPTTSSPHALNYNFIIAISLQPGGIIVLAKIWFEISDTDDDPT